MVNKIQRTIAFLLVMANKVISGMAELAAELTLPHSVAQDLPAKVAAMIAADNAHKASRGQLKAKRLTQTNAVKEARTFLQLVRENLKPRLGSQYSQAWNEVGFMGDLKVGNNPEALLRGLQSVKAYLTANPIADAGPNLGSARAGLAYDELTAAVSAFTSQQHAVALALSNRDAKTLAVQKAVRTVLSELHQVLDPMDARWLAFGFARPGQKQSPAIPNKVSAVLIGANAAALKWDKAARAEYYRVWKKVIGVDTEYVSVGSPADLDFTLENLPANAQIEVVITAVNNGGTSAYSEVVLIQTT